MRLRWLALMSLLAAFPIAFSSQTNAAELHVAVAANFSAPMQKIAKAFEQESGHHLVLSFGATGKFYAQIQNGAPFQVLLAADEMTPKRLEDEGLAVSGSRFMYAQGRLVLWSKNPALLSNNEAILKQGFKDKIAIADPKLAPYGAAAVEVMQALGVYQSLQKYGVWREHCSDLSICCERKRCAGFCCLVAGNARWENAARWCMDCALKIACATAPRCSLIGSGTRSSCSFGFLSVFKIGCGAQSDACLWL